MLAGIDPLSFLDYVGTDRVLVDKVLRQAEEERVRRTRELARAVGIEVAKALSGK